MKELLVIIMIYIKYLLLENGYDDYPVSITHSDYPGANVNTILRAA
jgi:hypothetical protein